MRAFLFVLEVEPMMVGNAYAKLPLHCTLVSWFRTQASAEKVIEIGYNHAKRHRPVELIAEAPALFGPKRTIPVHTLVPTVALTVLHGDLLEELKVVSPLFVEEKYIGRGFRPHVTTQQGSMFAPPARLMGDTIYLVEAMQPEDLKNKKVRAQFRMS
jgi:hypothetical protein